MLRRDYWLVWFGRCERNGLPCDAEEEEVPGLGQGQGRPGLGRAEGDGEAAAGAEESRKGLDDRLFRIWVFFRGGLLAFSAELFDFCVQFVFLPLSF